VFCLKFSNPFFEKKIVNFVAFLSNIFVHFVQKNCFHIRNKDFTNSKFQVIFFTKMSKYFLKNSKKYFFSWTIWDNFYQKFFFLEGNTYLQSCIIYVILKNKKDFSYKKIWFQWTIFLFHKIIAYFLVENDNKKSRKKIFSNNFSINKLKLPLRKRKLSPSPLPLKNFYSGYGDCRKGH